MRSYLDIDLATGEVTRSTLDGDALVNAGRYLIARKLNAYGAATVAPLSGDNPLVFSAGAFAGTNFSNANRTSIGCRSPLTGGVKEANAGGTFGVALGQLGIAGFTLHGAAPDWVVIVLGLDGQVRFDAPDGLLGLGNTEAAQRLHEKYGKRVSLALCGPVGEYQGLIAGIAVSDADLRPTRLAARGGVGAVMGAKRVKAVVAELSRMPELHDRKRFMATVKEYAAKLKTDEPVQLLRTHGTASMGDFTNFIGALPVRNFSAGSMSAADGSFRLGGQAIHDLNAARGGETTHACMPGCLIQCSNVYVDAQGREIASPIEYETIGLMGTNCGVEDPDDLARLNAVANDLGVDSIETGATLAVLMEAGLARFGDVGFMLQTLDEIRRGTETGRLYAQGTARVGRHFGVARVPVIKQQAISAYDPRVIEVTGVTMMVTAQGADHTAGNVPRLRTVDLGLDEIVAHSMEAQVNSAAVDSLGLCIFGRTVTHANLELIAQAINGALGTRLDAAFFRALGRATLRLEDRFNRAAGFTTADDELPQFFYREPLEPSGKVARFHAAEVREAIARWWAAQPADALS